MKLGILLGVSLATMLGSLGAIIIGATDSLQVKLVTGAVIGAQGATSTAVLTFVLSLIATFFFALIIKKPKKLMD